MLQNSEASAVDISPREQREIINIYAKLREAEAKPYRTRWQDRDLAKHLYSFLLRLLAISMLVIL